MMFRTVLLPLLSLALVSCGQVPADSTVNANAMSDTTSMNPQHSDSLSLATFGTGCFWCTEAIFQQLGGVEKVVSGYSGGFIKNPSYKEVCNGTTGHAEVVQITFNPSLITFSELLEVFFATHDPTTLNRQGNDVGTQYRSVIFFHDEEQKRLAELAVKAGNESGTWPDPIVTEVSSFSVFYAAEDYHQEYFDLNGTQPYCSYVIRPKVDKFKKKFAEKLKQPQVRQE
ncbi:MAG: peptide-methionine (S)-S-oxide reductase [Bacteroidota bacterium]